MARFAAIDVGSNSVLIHVAERQEGGLFDPVDDRAELTRLGEGLAENDQLSPAAMDRTMAALAGFVDLARTRDVQATVAVGTMALRRARNAQVFVDRARAELGLEIEVISGEEEARLGFLAACSSLPSCEGPVVVFDVGGGSTEFVLGRGGRIERSRSLELGALGLSASFLRGDPPTPAELAALAAHLEQALAGLELGPAHRVIGTGGTACNLAAHHHRLEVYDPGVVHGTVLGRRELAVVLEAMGTLTIPQRGLLPGIQVGRAATILAGTALVLAVLQSLGATALTVSDRGLRHSLLQERFGTG